MYELTPANGCPRLSGESHACPVLPARGLPNLSHIIRNVARDPVTNDTASQDEKRVFRNSAYPILGWILVVGFVGLVIGVGVGVPFTPRWAAVLVVPLFGVPAWIVYRAYIRSRVEANDNGITIVNPFRTVIVPWNQVDHVRADMRLVIVRRNGSSIRAWAVQAANAARMFKRKSFADDVARDLNVMLSKRQEGVGPLLHAHICPRLNLSPIGFAFENCRRN
jgi:hypothetical protein